MIVDAHYYYIPCITDEAEVDIYDIPGAPPTKPHPRRPGVQLVNARSKVRHAQRRETPQGPLSSKMAN